MLTYSTVSYNYITILLWHLDTSLKHTVYFSKMFSYMQVAMDTDDKLNGSLIACKLCSVSGQLSERMNYRNKLYALKLA